MKSFIVGLLVITLLPLALVLLLPYAVIHFTKSIGDAALAGLKD